MHERWGESRKLELSYCINFMPGEDAENEANYHKTIRALHSTMAEWERATGVNFVHIVADDTPDQDPHFIPAGNGDFGDHHHGLRARPGLVRGAGHRSLRRQ